MSAPTKYLWANLTKTQQDHLIDEYFDGESPREWVEDIVETLQEGKVFTTTRDDVGKWWDEGDEEFRKMYYPELEEF